ncbi:MAG: HAMP domain-containing histidine kinase [Lachnospiraceae bacterium]|nr:HAMP domain-containing histidine kinase [Lachnospiraceae bacterium]
MRKKISESIWAKTFISMLALLVGCCIVIYSMVMVFLPKNYQTELESQITSDFYKLIEVLEENGWEESSDKLFEFSMRNNATVKINDEDGDNFFSVNYANEEENEPASKSIACSAIFMQGGKSFQLSATVFLVAVTQSYDILIKLIPFIAMIILLISAVGAYACSRYFSKPLVNICSVANRMTTLDMTWKCDVERNDEIGVLASSLNKMSERLGDALDSLQTANEQLQQDIEKEWEQEKQRIDFFTSVSHELKTPIAIIKGELEGMIYQVGEYKNRDVYLCHCLKTANDMESIVKEILSAARMGGSDFQLVRTDLNISQMLQKSCQRVKGRMEDNQMELYLNIQPDFHYKGDGRLLEKVFSNVLSNAVAYSPKEAAIYVTLQNGVFCVENIGIHIAEEDLKRIFTPFYRVDKSRNRNTGGSGLGLYITKTILDHHSIAYRMENTEDGVKFLAEFSKEPTK